MLDKLTNIGDDLYRTWSEEQRHEEIRKLVKGYKNGLSIQILCQLAASIAGSPSLASKHISDFLSLKERKKIIKKHGGSNDEFRALLEATLL